jgi:hypothetical protein
MQICGLSLTPTETVAIVGVGTTILSELIASSPLRENSILQIGMSILKGYSRRIGAADTPRASDQKAAPVIRTQQDLKEAVESLPDKASPAPRRRGRPPGSKNSSRSGSKKA